MINNVFDAIYKLQYNFLAHFNAYSWFALQMISADNSYVEKVSDFIIHCRRLTLLSFIIKKSAMPTNLFNICRREQEENTGENWHSAFVENYL